MSKVGISLAGYLVPVSAKTIWFVMELKLGDAVGYGDATVIGSEVELAGLIFDLCRSVSAEPAETLPELLARVLQTDRTVLQTDTTLARRGLASALEAAWLSALAQRAHVPLVSILGGAVRRDIPFYANINRGIVDRSPEGFARKTREIVAESAPLGVKVAPFDGFRCGKSSLRIAHDLVGTGIERVAAVREALGPEKLLLVDCHFRFSPVLARELFRELSHLNVFWVEDPCNTAFLGPNEPRALRGCANDLGMRVAGGESVVHLGEMSALLGREGHDVVLPDLRYTGIRTGMSMLALAQARGAEASLHNPAGPVLDAVSVHVSGALPDFLILERQLGETPLFVRITESPIGTADGNVMVPGEPGLGISIDGSLLNPVSVPLDWQQLTGTFNGMSGVGPDA